MARQNFRNAPGRAQENLMGIFIVGLLWDGILRSSFSPLRDPGGVGLVAEAGRPLRHPQLVEVDIQGLRLVPQVDLEVLPGVLQHSELVPRCLRLVFQPSPGGKGRFTTQRNCACSSIIITHFSLISWTSCCSLRSECSTGSLTTSNSLLPSRRDKHSVTTSRGISLASNALSQCSLAPCLQCRIRDHLMWQIRVRACGHYEV